MQDKLRILAEWKSSLGRGIRLTIPTPLRGRSRCTKAPAAFSLRPQSLCANSVPRIKDLLHTRA
jgi:hypothetical protein